LGEEMRTGNGGGGGGVQEGCEVMEAVTERERTVFWEEKYWSKSAELGRRTEGGRGGKKRAVERWSWRVEMALKTEGRNEWNDGDKEWRWCQRLERKRVTDEW